MARLPTPRAARSTHRARAAIQAPVRPARHRCWSTRRSAGLNRIGVSGFGHPTFALVRFFVVPMPPRIHHPGWASNFWDSALGTSFHHLYKPHRISTISALAVSPKRRRVALCLRSRTPESHRPGYPDLSGTPASASARSSHAVVGPGNHPPAPRGPAFPSTTPGCKSNTSPPIPPNSSRRSMSETRPIAPYPTEPQRTWQTFTASSGSRSAASVTRKHFSGPAFTLPISQGPAEAFHYL